MGKYNTAQVCLNGHVITCSYETSLELRQPHCDKCGYDTIIDCPSCLSKIRGHYDVEYGLPDSMKSAPAYCYNCGKPYPWTEAYIEATKELLKLEENISKEDFEYFSNNMDSIISDTPKTKVVATKFKIFLNKASKEVSSGIRDILVDIASEAAKKTLFP
ncbi:DUF2321 domain-containing protein [Clostridium algidicarnis]|uniref:DUF2321 domain-containing protein n=1 Tax=Clostridium algidicarnis TaxID=37659 RepID=UPI001C0C1EC5|nr:DUF2321 domain-containing protein [Clostridium algidicarnis]MBU3205580.1 DUF2321 domain-containing protein [Clostridium algidicarnis]